MNICKFLSSLPLSPYVKEYIILESNQNIQNKTIPDTAVVMSFRYRGEVVKISEGGTDEVIAETAISGLRKSARVFQYAEKTANLLVIFREGGLPAFSKIPVHELFESNISSDNLFTNAELKEILERLAEATTNQARISIVESFLVKHVTSNRHDALVTQAVRAIEKQNGIVRIKDLASNFNISQDPFEKRFRKVVGATPKQFASILRLRYLIKHYSSFNSLTETAYNAGYFDQSHFIKDFRQFTGQAPKDFFKSSLYW